MINVLKQPRVIGLEIGDRPRSDARVHCGLCNRGSDHDDEPRIERLGYEVLGPELQFLVVAIGRGNDVGLFGHREIGDGAHRGKLHRLVDRGCAHVECAAKNEWEAKHIVDLVRKVRAAGGDDRIGPRRLREVGHDLRLGIGQSEDQRLLCHLLEELRLQHARG